jgi:TonB family protein
MRLSVAHSRPRRKNPYIISSVQSRSIVIILISFTTTVFSADSADSAARGWTQHNSTATAPAATAVPYADTPRDLEKLAADIFRAGKKNDTTMFNYLVSSLSEPVTSEWFHDAFGNDGDLMLKEYPGGGAAVAKALQAFFSKLQKEKFTQPRAQRHETACDDNSGETIYPVMVMRQRPVPLYELRFHEGDKFFRLWAIAYVNGGFRFVGDLHPPEFRGAATKLTPSAAASNGDENRVRMAGNVIAAKLLHRVQPEYPDIARHELLQGTVRLHAIIAKDGTIRQLRVQTGYCSLGEAAMKAVRQWRYSPTLLEGKPVEVDTTIDVIYTLNR